ncbi:hypothetical protein T484DRAFT_1780619 [Baffinella frigidus]|nr:hypothetical protein T484DRAFT_1780619 [Cryptophyta sp. CCMP2293]
MSVTALEVGERGRIFSHCPLPAELVAVVVGNLEDARVKWKAVAALVGRVGKGVVDLVLSSQRQGCIKGIIQLLQAIAKHATQLTSLQIVCGPTLNDGHVRKEVMQTLRTLSARQEGGLQDCTSEVEQVEGLSNRHCPACKLTVCLKCVPLFGDLSKHFRNDCSSNDCMSSDPLCTKCAASTPCSLCGAAVCKFCVEEQCGCGDVFLCEECEKHAQCNACLKLFCLDCAKTGVSDRGGFCCQACAKTSGCSWCGQICWGYCGEDQEMRCSGCTRLVCEECLEDDTTRFYECHTRSCNKMFCRSCKGKGARTNCKESVKHVLSRFGV